VFADPVGRSCRWIKRNLIVTTPSVDRRAVWLLTGLLAGLGIASLWPVEQAHAVATDRDQKFAITTVESFPTAPEAVFVLDFLTGRLTGALLNPQSGLFTNFYFRNIAADFNNAKGKFAIIPGAGVLLSGGGATTSSGVLYIAELSSGKVVAYRYPYRNSVEPIDQVFPLEPFASFPFKEPKPNE